MNEQSEQAEQSGQPQVETPAPFSESVVVAVSPERLYDLVSDVTRTGEWSPICQECWWDEGAGPEVGAWFSGRNQSADRTWQTRSQVVAARRGREFAWQVGGNLVRWAYTLRTTPDSTPNAPRTELTESWEFLPDGLAMFAESYGASAAEEVRLRSVAAYDGIPVTLAAIKATAEGSA